MSGQCYEPEEFERLLDLAGDHDDRRHLEACGVCRAEFDLYQSFMSRENVPEGADLEDANARLRGFLAKEIGTGEAGAKPGVILTSDRRWNMRRWSPILAAACIAAVAIFINLGDDQQIVAPSGVVRDMAGDNTGLVAAVSPATDGFLFTWQGEVGADSYEIVVLDTAMQQIDRFEAGASGEYRIRRQDHPWLRKPGPYLWYLIARQNGDEIARSKVRTLEPGP